VRAGGIAAILSAQERIADIAAPEPGGTDAFDPTCAPHPRFARRGRPRRLQPHRADPGWRRQLHRPGDAEPARRPDPPRRRRARLGDGADTRRFSIRYVSSSNLDYDGRVIHRNYNSWVQNLQNGIIVESGKP
jgi:hypothetical protein